MMDDHRHPGFSDYDHSGSSCNSQHTTAPRQPHSALVLELVKTGRRGRRGDPDREPKASRIDRTLGTRSKLISDRLQVAGTRQGLSKRATLEVIQMVSPIVPQRAREQDRRTASGFAPGEYETLRRR